MSGNWKNHQWKNDATNRGHGSGLDGIGNRLTATEGLSTKPSGEGVHANVLNQYTAVETTPNGGSPATESLVSVPYQFFAHLSLSSFDPVVPPAVDQR